ncbi:MAG: uracil-DNA glycosylase [Mariprofundaceae bacterium]|nr:uracil-DNA glycosylase [Mariprofundaceae bacterium]
MNDYIKIEASWKCPLEAAFKKSSMHDLRVFLTQRKQQRVVIYPPARDYFSALNITPFTQVKVVILGQDPYHGEGQAHGLCFSVPPYVPLPPSLQNIFKEMHNDLNLPMPEHGCLTHWAKQGVLLLNSVLTVEKGKAAAHQGKGWESFTDDVIAVLNEQKEHVVFILWGAYAQKKASFVDKRKHFIIKAPHPSPLSSYRGFFGQRYFSRTNHDLQEHGLDPIDWQLPHLEEAKQQFQEIERMNQQILHG